MPAFASRKWRVEQRQQPLWLGMAPSFLFFLSFSYLSHDASHFFSVQAAAGTAWIQTQSRHRRFWHSPRSPGRPCPAITGDNMLLYTSASSSLSHSSRLSALDATSTATRTSNFTIGTTWTRSLENQTIVQQPDQEREPKSTRETRPLQSELSGAAMISQESRTGYPTRKAANGATSPVDIVQSLGDLLHRLDQAQNDDDDTSQQELLVVLYHAHYCKICQRAGIVFRKIALEHTDDPKVGASHSNNHVRFAKMEASSVPAETLRSLGITKFPFVQIYRQGDCVASFSTGPSHLFQRKVRDTLHTCLERSAHDQWKGFTDQFSKEIAENRMARQQLSRELDSS